MIELKNKVECCGCTACREICPVTCISMLEDDEGFRYPVTDMSACINCNACNRVCPVINKKQDATPFNGSVFYAAQIKDEVVLRSSSSGGMFSLISSMWIEDGGIVYGARWYSDEIKHVKIETVEELKFLRGSKYAQSNMGDTFREIKALLEEGRKILFSGTPCQVDGLKRYLLKPYAKLLTIEVACHGVPSPLVLKKYLSELKSVYLTDVSLNFRDKSNGWLNYNVKALDPQGNILFCESHNDNIFMRGFLHELYSRPSCHECPSKGGTSRAELTLCDFWGVEKVCPDFPYQLGASLVIANTSVGKQLIETVASQAFLRKVDADSALLQNGSLLYSSKPHPDRKYFFKKLSITKYIEHLIRKCLRLRVTIKLRLSTKSYIQRVRTWK